MLFSENSVSISIEKSTTELQQVDFYKNNIGGRV